MLSMDKGDYRPELVAAVEKHLKKAGIEYDDTTEIFEHKDKSVTVNLRVNGEPNRVDEEKLKHTPFIINRDNELVFSLKTYEWEIL